MEKKELQNPLNISEQIENLKSIGLTVTNEDYAKQILNDISYFRLIKAFSLGLKQRNGNYYDGITFEEIVELYLFNSKFRQLLFPLIERIEINLRCRISNYFSKKYGCLGYENADNFSNSENHADIMGEIEIEINRNRKSPFVRNFTENYIEGKLPFYAVIELFSFGTLSKFYKNMKNPDKKEIAKTYGIGYTYLESWIESIAYIRNICAHYGRIYNMRLAKTPILYKQYQELNIKNNRVFGLLLCMKHIFYNDAVIWNSFVQKLSILSKEHPHIDLSFMGFTEDWKTLLDIEMLEENT